MVKELIFFNSSWEQRSIDFESSESGLYRACTWKITKKILESPFQLEKWQLEEDEIPSESEALFECVNPENEEQKAFILVYMQVPHSGTEFETSKEKMKQASEDLSAPSSIEFEALKILNRGGCLFCPKIINYKQEKQDELGILPGGYVLYIALEKWPGIRLTKQLFWALPRQERDSIREAFRESYKALADLGVVNYTAELTNLRWCKQEKRIIFVKFQMSKFTTKKEEWREIMWYCWGLADAPEDLDISATDGKKIDEEGWIL